MPDEKIAREAFAARLALLGDDDLLWLGLMQMLDEDERTVGRASLTPALGLEGRAFNDGMRAAYENAQNTLRELRAAGMMPPKNAET